jgi:transposase-like protein
MAGRRIFNEQDARRCLAAAKASQASLAEWSRAHGVDGRSLNLWRVNLERRGGPRPSGALKVVELVPVPSPSGTRGPFRLHIRGVELEVSAEFDEEALRRLVGVLKSC